jgi:predicted nucleic acid-binding protein
LGNRKVLIDSSIIIDHLRKTTKRDTRLAILFEDYSLFLSSISVFELYCGAIDEQKKQDIQDILYSIPVLHFDEHAAIKAGELFVFLKKMNNIIDTRDLFIAAIAMVNNLPLATLNVKHFQRLAQLELIV